MRGKPRLFPEITEIYGAESSDRLSRSDRGAGDPIEVRGIGSGCGSGQGRAESGDSLPGQWIGWGERRGVVWVWVGSSKIGVRYAKHIFLNILSRLF